MEVDALSPSPLARYLLELEQRRASGRLEVGGRRLVLHEGAVTDVLPAEGDLSLLGFLTAAGRLEDAQADELPQGAREGSGHHLDEELLRRKLLDKGTLKETRRALWLDRLVRGLERDEQDATPHRHLEPHGSPPGPYRFATLPLVLDALTRRAGHADAERVGRHAAASFEWLGDDEQTGRARRWADLGDDAGARPVSAVLLSHPGAASRIAALVRAGFARLTRASDPPPPPDRRRAPSIPPPTGRRAALPPAPALPPPGPGDVLAPGLAATPEPPLGIAPVQPWFAIDTTAIDDPLDALERRIAAAEQARQPGAARAELWLEFARVALEHYGSVEEAARAAREAAAADPDSADAHHAAAEHCASMGQPALAYAYAKAAAALTTDSRQRMQRLSHVAQLAVRCGKPDSALRALERACEDPSADAWVFEHHARTAHAQRDLGRTVRWARRAAEKQADSHPTGALHLLAWVHGLSPADPELAAEYASLLAQQGLGEAAAAVLQRAARATEDVERRASLRGNAAIRAELGGRPDLAAEALLDSFEEDPHRVTLHEPLVANLESAGLVREAALIAEEIAGVCEAPQRGPWLVRAASLHLGQGGCGPVLRRLLGEALKCPGSFEAAWQQAQELARREESIRALTDVLEIALQDPRVPRETRATAAAHLVQAAAELGAPALERWGHALRQEIDGTQLPDAEVARLADAGKARTEAIVALEAQLESATEGQRLPLMVELARLWRDDPQRRIRAIQQYDHILDREGSSAVAQELCELLWLADDQEALLRTATSAPERAHEAVLLSAAYAARMRGDFQYVSELCLAVLARSPRHEEAMALLGRAERVGLEGELARRVATAQLEGSNDPRRRARTLTRLADNLLGQGDVLGALDAAGQALATDPRAARAAEVVLEHHTALDGERAVSLSRAARQVLGDHPRLLWQLAQASGLAGDHARQIEALETLARQSPFLSGATVELLRVRARTSDDVQALVRCVETALAPARRGESTVIAVQEGLERLWSLGEHERTLRLCVAAADALGEGTDALLQWGEARAAERGMSRPRAAVLERLVARLSDDGRLERLRDLAHLEQTCERPASEVRAWLRVLALRPDDDEGLSRLSALYGAAGDPDRMMSVLTLRLEAAKDPRVRALALLDLAAASMVVADDATTAAEMVRGAFQDDPELDDDMLRRAVGLLMSRSPQAAFDLLLTLAADERHEKRAGSLYQEAVALAATALDAPRLALNTALTALEQVPERTQILLQLEGLALAQEGHDQAVATYDALIERALGMHGRRALLYRKARFLERSGQPSAALDAYVAGFRLAPSAGVVLASIERLAAQSDRHDALVDCLLELAPLAPFADRRTELYARAAEICERSLDDPARALSVCRQSFEAAPEQTTAKLAAGILKHLRERDAPAARAAMESWRAFVEQRAEAAWDVTGKVHALLCLGVLWARGMEDTPAVDDVGRRAIEALDADTDDVDEGETRAGLYAAVARMLLDAGASQELAKRAVAQGLALKPRDDRLRALAEGRPSPSPGPAAVVSETGDAPPPPPEAGEPAPRDAISARPYAGAVSHRPAAGVVQVQGALRLGRRESTGGAPAGATLPPPALAPVTTHEVDRPPNPIDAVGADALPPAPSVPQSQPDDLPSLCEAVGHGDEEAAMRVLEIVRGRSDRAGVALDHLLRRAREGVGEPALLTTLATLGPLAGQLAIRTVAREALGEPAATPMTPVDPPPAGEALAAALAAAREDEATAPARRILELTWRHAAPLFRRALHTYGVGSEHLLTPQPADPIDRALQVATELTGQSCEIYDVGDADSPLQVTCTSPPALLMSSRLDVDPPVLRMQFATHLERTRDEALLLSAMEPEEAERLVDALRAAFGPTSSRDSLEREAAAVAAELWRTIPPVMQREITELFRDLDQPLSRAPVALALEKRALRVGLIATGHVGIALQHIQTAAGRDSLAAAQGRKGPLGRALLAFAFSEPYLRLRG